MGESKASDGAGQLLAAVAMYLTRASFPGVRGR